jgi:lysophospholipase L1-like esterase
MRSVLAVTVLTLISCVGQCQSVGGGTVGSGGAGGGAVGEGGVGGPSGGVTVAADPCTAVLPSGGAYGTLLVNLNAADMDGDGDCDDNPADLSDTSISWVSTGTDGATFTSSLGNEPFFEDPCQALGGNAPCLHFQSSSNMVSDQPASTYVPLHGNDVSCYASVRFRGNDADDDFFAIATTAGLGNSSVGMVFEFNDNSANDKEYQVEIRDGAGAQAVKIGPAQTLEFELDHSLAWVYEFGKVGDDLAIYAESVSQGTAESTGTASTSDPVGTLHIGSATNTTHLIKGRIQRFACYTTAHGDDERAAITAILDADIVPQTVATPTNCTIPSAQTADSTCPGGGALCRVLVLGDSLSEGVTTNERWWPEKAEGYLLDSLGAGTYGFRNFADSGDDAAAIATQWSQASAFSWDVVVMLGGTNDINDGTSGAATFTALETNVDAAQTAGANVIWVTNPPREDYTGGGWTAAKQTELDALNSAIVGAADADTFIVDTYTVFEEPTDADALRLTWSTDGLHPNDLGNDCLTRMIVSAL